MNKKLKCLAYLDVENLTSSEIIGVTGKLKANEELSLVSLKAYGNVNVLGNKVAACNSIGADIIDTSLISQTKKNLADTKIIVDCITDVFTFSDIKSVAILSKDNDFLPLITKLTSMGIKVFTMISSVNSIQNEIATTKRYLQAAGAWPVQSESALENQYKILSKYSTESVTNDMIAKYLEYRRSNFVKKISGMVPEDCLNEILKSDIRNFDFNTVKSIISGTSSFPLKGLAEMYTGGMFGVFPPKEVLDTLEK